MILSNQDIIERLHQMVTQISEVLDEPMLEGTMPMLRATYPSRISTDHGDDNLRLTVGVEFVAAGN